MYLAYNKYLIDDSYYDPVMWVSTKEVRVIFVSSRTFPRSNYVNKPIHMKY